MDNVFDIVMITAWVLLYSFLWYRLGIHVEICREEKEEEKRNSGSTERVERVEAYQMPPGFNNNKYY